MVGVLFVSIAVSLVCKKLLPLNWKLFLFRTNFSSWSSEEFVGLMFLWFRIKPSVILAASIPTLCGILVYKLSTSRVTKIALSGIF